MALSKLYQSSILEHNRAPHRHFELPNATHEARGLDALCGDDIRLWIRLEGGRIQDAAWTGEACVITTAAASMLCKWLPGKTIGKLESGYGAFASMLDNPEAGNVPELGEFNSLRAVSGFPSRVRNALLPWKTALQAIRDDGTG